MGRSNNTFNDEKSFKEFSEEWLEYIRSFHKPSTHIKYRNIIYRYFLPVLGDSDLRSITNVSIEDIVSHVWDGEDGSPSHSTVRSVRSVYQSIAKYCDIDINPQMLRWQTLSNITTYPFPYAYRLKQISGGEFGKHYIQLLQRTFRIERLSGGKRDIFRRK